MTRYEYKLCPAPTRGRKVKGLKTPEARFANAVEARINEMAAEGWDYLRSDILPSEERQGLTSSHVVYRTLLVFRRALADGVAHPEPLPEDEAAAPETPETPAATAETAAPAAETGTETDPDTPATPRP